MTSDPRPAPVGRYVGRRHSCVAREHDAGYDTSDRRGKRALDRADVGQTRGGGRGPDDAGDPDGGRDTNGDVGPPLGVPVLAEVPELAGPLEAFAQADRLMVQMVLGLARLLETDRDTTVETTGVGVEHWLALTASAPRLERRTWLRAARLLVRLPQLRSQVDAGVVSAGQLRALTIALHGTPTAIDGPLDDWLADAATELHRLGADPDALVEQARQALTELTDHTEVVENEANRTRSLHLQPRLDGSGGTFHGDEDAYGFAILEAATRPRPNQTDDIGLARADNLQALLHRTTPDACEGPDTTDGEPGEADIGSDTRAGDDQLTGDVHRSWTHAIADAEHTDAAYHQQQTDLPDLAERIASYANTTGPAPPKLLLRAELSSLLEHGRTPATVLTTLAGGQLRMTSAAARALVDAHGADLRLTIIDHGHVVGVGRTTRRPPGWLTDTLHTIHDHCTGPLCDRPAHGADTDHTTPWHPDNDQPASGTTDLDNLGPLCNHTNRNRPATGWHPRQHDTTGTRTWTHPRTGLTTTSIPTTWRPPTRHRTTGPPHDPAPDPAPEPDDLPF